MNEPEDVVVGIDVAKAALDVAVRPRGEERHLANDPAGIAAAGEGLQTVRPHVIVVEATGGYEVPLVAGLGIANLPVPVGNPPQLPPFPPPPGPLPKPDPPP